MSGIARSATDARNGSGAGYTKGDETKRRILAIAMQAFGEDGFTAVSTRRIAEASGVTLPVLQYHFGNKEGLYRACAEAIIERYAENTAGPAAAAVAALAASCDAEAARMHLKAVIAALVMVMVESKQTGNWTPFAAREVRDPGAAFDLLFDRLWRPGLETVTQLVARVRGVAPENPEAAVQALMLISSLSAFGKGREVATRALKWKAIGARELKTILGVLDAQIDALR